MMITVSYDEHQNIFICRCSFEDRATARDNHFFWNPMKKYWYTRKLSSAVRLKKYFDDSARARIKATSVEVLPPGPFVIQTPKGKKLKHYQIDGARFALERNHSYLAFDMGLGKTATFIAVMNVINARTLIICPPFLVENWKREIREWAYHKPEVGVVETSNKVVNQNAQVILLPDSLLDKESIRNYLLNSEFKLLAVDEAHRFKTASAVRTKALFENITPHIPKVVLLSGTPMPNRPMELYPVLSHLAHNTIDFKSEHDFGVRYCGGFEKQIPVDGVMKIVWDYTGASNLDELKITTKNFMLRYTKAEMLPELHPKEERIVFLSGGGAKGIKKLEADVLKKLGPGLSNIMKNQGLGAVARYRSEIGLRKVRPAIQYISGVLEAGETILVLAWHIAVLNELDLGLKNFKRRLITGATPKPTRQQMVNDIQRGKAQVLIAQITTMVGYNLTKSTRAIIVEPSWAPSDNQQAVDRIHRIGQKDSVIVDYLILPDSIDGRVVQSFMNKQKNINQAIG